VTEFMTMTSTTIWVTQTKELILPVQYLEANRSPTLDAVAQAEPLVTLVSLISPVMFYVKLKFSPSDNHDHKLRE